jgi:hypothetical protein
VSPCWCWRSTFIIQASKAPAVASSDTARSATGGFGAMQQRSLRGNLVLLFADVTIRNGVLAFGEPAQTVEVHDHFGSMLDLLTAASKAVVQLASA